MPGARARRLEELNSSIWPDPSDAKLFGNVKLIAAERTAMDMAKMRGSKNFIVTNTEAVNHAFAVSGWNPGKQTHFVSDKCDQLSGRGRAGNATLLTFFYTVRKMHYCACCGHRVNICRI